MLVTPKLFKNSCTERFTRTVVRSVTSKPLHQSEPWYTTIHMKMSFICKWMKSRFHMKGWARRLGSRKRFKEIRKLPIVGTLININICRVLPWFVLSLPTRRRRSFPHFGFLHDFNTWTFPPQLNSNTIARSFCLLPDNWSCKWQRVSHQNQRETTKRSLLTGN